MRRFTTSILLPALLALVAGSAVAAGGYTPVQAQVHAPYAAAVHGGAQPVYGPPQEVYGQQQRVYRPPQEVYRPEQQVVGPQHVHGPRPAYGPQAVDGRYGAPPMQAVCGAPRWDPRVRYMPGQVVWRRGSLWLARRVSARVYNENSPPEWTPQYWVQAVCR